MLELIGLEIGPLLPEFRLWLNPSGKLDVLSVRSGRWAGDVRLVGDRLVLYMPCQYYSWHEFELCDPGCLGALVREIEA